MKMLTAPAGGSCLPCSLPPVPGKKSASPVIPYRQCCGKQKIVSKARDIASSVLREIRREESHMSKGLEKDDSKQYVMLLTIKEPIRRTLSF